MYTMTDNSLTWSFLVDNILAASRLGHYLRETPRFGNYPLQNMLNSSRTLFSHTILLLTVTITLYNLGCT